ncbi:MAG TPA: hypothetical protein VFO10_10205 [Oligoflexus sp.]|uniref:hypothetical protein n=1 Tax=Oligoflexus sp. TaxID=1971216 RepID=UPI002D801F48|nr:hypothetical protein [Oligoflexus sp.]HET9237614.1 hypothetical protein [Oligoflexus sp.]
MFFASWKRPIWTACLLAATLGWSHVLVAADYENYPVDLKPMEKYPELHQEWTANKAKYADDVMPEPILKRQLEIIESISAKEPAWVDGLWMVADSAFQLGASYTDEKDLPFARSVFVRGQKSAERCIEKKTDHPICALFLGAMIGKIASIDGIFSSLKKAKQVEKLWLSVVNSKYNYRFAEASSLQGSARYALGMFYRLVPDFFLMKWLFDVKGDINKSVKYHRDAIAVDPANACSKIMLAASLLCSVKGDTKDPNGQEGLKHLRDARQMTAKSMVAKACQNDTARLEREPGKACGYETARQQETSEDEFKKQQQANAH